MTYYKGVRNEHEAFVLVFTCEKSKHLPIRLDLVNHSPDGFNWGYAGSGPAQLALALLAHAIDDKIALKYHQKFKFLVISMLENNEWFMTKEYIVETIQKISAEEKTNLQARK